MGTPFGTPKLSLQCLLLPDCQHLQLYPGTCSSGPCDQALWTTDKGSLLKPTPGRNALVSEGWTGYSLSPQQALCLCPNLKSETVTSSVEEWEERGPLELGRKNIKASSTAKIAGLEQAISRGGKAPDLQDTRDKETGSRMSTQGFSEAQSSWVAMGASECGSGTSTSESNEGGLNTRSPQHWGQLGTN